MLERFVRRGVDVTKPTDNGNYLHLWLKHHEKETNVEDVTRSIRVLIDVSVGNDIS